MSKTKNANELREQIANTEKEIRQRENRVQELIQKKKTTENKMRTRRLIERGAILESMITDADKLTNEQIKKLLVSAFIALDMQNTAEEDETETDEFDDDLPY